MDNKIRSKGVHDVILNHGGFINQWAFLIILMFPVLFFVGMRVVKSPTVLGDDGKITLLGKRYYLEITAFKIDLNKIKVGQGVDVDFDAYIDQKIGDVPGKLLAIEKSDLDDKSDLKIILPRGLVTKQGIKLSQSVCLKSKIRVISWRHSFWDTFISSLARTFWMKNIVSK